MSLNFHKEAVLSHLSWLLTQRPLHLSSRCWCTCSPPDGTPGKLTTLLPPGGKIWNHHLLRKQHKFTANHYLLREHLLFNTVVGETAWIVVFREMIAPFFCVCTDVGKLVVFLKGGWGRVNERESAGGTERGERERETERETENGRKGERGKEREISPPTQQIQ